ncbi:MAG: hypothetical protein R3330_19515, partial [Saprospiraceae bacterium]|nr:hypothetical protein [Saprospiraceae bacterium]
IQSNHAQANGGGIFVDGGAMGTGAVHIEGNLIQDNLADGASSGNCECPEDTGGGITVFSSSANIINNVIRNNESHIGGGLHLASVLEFAVTVQENLIDSNIAVSGGGLHATHRVSLTLIRNTISGNLSETHGGGIRMFAGFVEGNVIADNHSASGGGIYAISGSLVDNIISGNERTYGGGVFLQGGGPVTITGCTIAENRAAWGFGGGGIAASAGPLSLSHSILAFNHGGAMDQDIHGVVTAVCTNIYGNEGGWADVLQGATDGGDNFSLPPAFCSPLGSGDYGLAESSPCTAENSPCGQLVGAQPVSCQSVAVEAVTWSELKGSYR